MSTLTSIISTIFSVSAQGINSVFGSPIKPPGPVFDNPVDGLGKVLMTTVQTFVLFAAFAALIYLLWGAIQWITSGGEQEKLEKSRLQMTHAVLGIILLIAVLGIFTVITGDILGVIRKDEQGNWRFVIQTVNSCVAHGQTCVQSSSVCCVSTEHCIPDPLATPPPGSAVTIYKCQ